MAMSKLLKIGILFIAILGTVIAPSPSFAQTSEDINYVHQAKYKADSLYNAAAAFHASFVQPIDDIIAADPLLKQQLDNYINEKPIKQEKEKEVIEIAKLRYDAVEMWYDIREELDNLLIDMCRYCLSQPCDTVGNYNWLRTKIEPMLDSVFHKSYTKCIAEYRVLLDNYELYTKEIGEFLKRNYKYTKIDGGLTEKQRTSIMNDFNGLKYMKYYNQRNKPPKEKPVYSPHLNNILQEFQRMVDSGFKNSKERYIKLGSELRNKSVAQLDKNAPKALKNDAVEDLLNSANHKEPESDIFKKKDSKHNNSKQDKPDLEDPEETNEGTSITPLN